MTETAELADIVLPATMFLEHDDIYRGGGHQHITARAEARRTAGRRAHQPLRHRGTGEAPRRRRPPRLRPDRAPAHRQHAGRSGRPGLRRAASRKVDRLPARVRERAYLERLRLAGRQVPLPARLDRFARPQPAAEERWGSRAPQAPAGVSRPCRHDRDAPTRSTPSGWRRRRRAISSTRHSQGCPDRANAKAGRRSWFIPRMPPISACARATSSRSATGAARCASTSASSTAVRRGVLIAEGIWPNADHLDGEGINMLTGSDPCAPYGGAAFHDNRVWVRAG